MVARRVALGRRLDLRLKPGIHRRWRGALVGHLAGFETLGWSAQAVGEALEGIGGTLTEVFILAKDNGITTELAAEQMARSRIDAAKRT